MRDTKGRWVKGTTGNPGGRRTGDKSAKYWAIIQSACSLKDWRAIVRKAIEQAKGGDRFARAWLADRLLGKDPVILDITPMVDEAFSTALEKVYGPVSGDEPD